MSLYAVLDDIELEIIAWLDGLDMRFAADYAEQGLIGRKSLIQHTGWRPDEVRIKAMLHASWCNPAAEVARLKSALDEARPLAFVLGTGEYRGIFVVHALEVATRQTDGAGAVIALEVDIALKEYVGDPAEPLPPGVIREGYRIPIATEAEPPLIMGDLGGPLAAAGAVVSGALAAIGAAADALVTVETLDRVARLDPASAALLLPGAAAAMSDAAARLPVAACDDLRGIAAVAADVARLSDAMQSARSMMTDAGIALERGLSGVAAAAQGLRGAQQTLEGARGALAGIAKAVATRAEAPWFT